MADPAIARLSASTSGYTLHHAYNTRHGHTKHCAARGGILLIVAVALADADNACSTTRWVSLLAGAAWAWRSKGSEAELFVIYRA